MADKFDQLLSIATPDEQLALQVVHNACVETLTKYNLTKTKDDLKNWKAAEAEKISRIDMLWAKYNQSAPAYKNVKEVIDYLQGQGYAVKSSTVYAAVKTGKLQREPDGRVLELAVRAYTGTLRKKEQSDPGENVKGRMEQEERKIRIQADRLELDYQKKLKQVIPLEDLELWGIERAAVFENAFRFNFSTLADDIIELVHGDRTRAPDLIEMLNGWLDTGMNELSNAESFRVTFLAGDDDNVPDLDDDLDDEDQYDNAVGE